MKNLWTWIVAAFTFLIGLFLWEKNQKEDAQAKLDNANANKENEVLAQHTADVKAEDAKVDADAAAKKAEPVTQQDLLDFLNKDKT